LGHQIEAVIRALHKPVLVVNKPFSQPERLMLAYDGSEAANKALDWLVTSPLYKNMQCHLVHVCSDAQKGQTLLDSALNTLRNANIDCESTVLTGEPLAQLLAYQAEQQIDLMVMGSFGHSRLREMFLGSLTLKLLTQSKVPLLLLR
jgi:nucleotide-binding universal stress UspA family protein